MSQHNADIIAKLEHIADAYKSKGIIHKYKAYRNAIDTIRGISHKILSEGDVKGLPGIGTAMLEKIREITTTGSLQQEKEVLSDPIAQALQLFTSIHGIGPVLARKLVYEQGLRTMEDLSAVHLSPQARMGMRYHDDALLRIPAEEVRRHHAFVQSICHSHVDPRLSATVCGSYRRGNATSGDIDILLTHPASALDAGCEYIFLNVAVAALRKVGYVLDALADGPQKFMGYCRLSNDGAALPCRRIDIRWFPHDVFAAALLYFTGSDMFNVRMRQRAIELGYTLTEYGLFFLKNGARGDRVAGLTTERDIFAALQMPFVEPQQRC